MSLLAERLKIIRNALGESQKGMSKRLGLGVNAWSRYENGQNMPGADVIESLAKMGFNGHWLLTGEGSPSIRGAISPSLSPSLEPRAAFHSNVAILEETARLCLREGAEPYHHEGEGASASQVSEKPYLPILMKTLIISAQRTAKERIQAEGRPYTFREVAEMVLQMYDMIEPIYASGKNKIDHDGIDTPNDTWP